MVGLRSDSLRRLSHLLSIGIFCILRFGSLPVAGAFLVFITYPLGLSQLPIPQFWCALFFFMVLLLGVDSMFSAVEGFVTPLADSKWLQDVPRWKIVLAVIVGGLAMSAFYCLDIGLTLLNNMDFFITNVTLTALAVAKTFLCGWVLKHQCADIVGPVPLLVWGAAFFGGSALGIGLAYGIASVGAIVGPCVAVVVIIAGAVTSYLWAQTKNKELSHKQRLWWLFLGSVELLRQDVNELVCVKKENEGWFRVLREITPVWSVIIKYLIPPIALLFLAVDIHSFVQDFFKDIFYKAFGMLTLAGNIGLIVASIIMPDLPLFEAFLNDQHDEEWRAVELQNVRPTDHVPIPSPVSRMSNSSSSPPRGVGVVKGQGVVTARRSTAAPPSN
eukprot:Platyproteum_vivax@DN5967_c0_g3_i2.p1